MKTATQNLENDHEYILRLTDAMEQMAVKPSVNPDDLETVVDIIRNFADGLHHAKEENLLFPGMVQKGFSFENGPVAVMMSEHEEGREFVRTIAENIPAYRAGDTGVLDAINSSLTGYAGLLKNHIYKENNVLFKMADNVFSQGEQQNLLEKFDKVETADSNKTPSVYIKKIEILATAYGV